MLLEAEKISFKYSRRSPLILSDLSLKIAESERVGLVAPSGYGKTTLAKLLAGFETPMSGRILIGGKVLPKRGISPVQMISQHPETAINPCWKMRQVLMEAGQFSTEILQQIGIEEDFMNRYKRELSGGELQRFCIARSLISGAQFLIADEISTMFDVVTQAQIWYYILEESERRNIGLLVMSHNPELLRRVCTRIIDLREINHLK